METVVPQTLKAKYAWEVHSETVAARRASAEGAVCTVGQGAKATMETANRARAPRQLPVPAHD
jgi:hypothetical protein